VRDLQTDELRSELKVLDFGASILLDPQGERGGDEGVFGTPHYMSPEQASGAALDHRTDLYSAAVVLYEMISGALPHEGDGVQALIYNIATEPAIPLRTREPSLPGSYYEFFARALAREPSRRFESAEEMRAALRGLSGALARLERHTELYLAAIPDLTPVTAAPIEPASAADPPRESEGSTTITGTSASASATAPAAASPATRARARGTSWVAGAGIGAAAGLAFYLASGGGGAGSVGVGAVSGAAAALALRWMSLKRET
jgi:serine/threonine protein kinase